MYDTNRNRRFDRNEITKIFRSRNISLSDIELGYIFDEYDPKNLGYVDYNDLERDFQNFVSWMEIHRPRSRMSTNLNLPTILRMIKDYSDQTGKSLREIFKKTKVGDSDEISNFDFTRFLTEITYS